MVAIDAFSQAFTNPLLSPRVYNPQTFSPLGWQLIRDDEARCRTWSTATSRIRGGGSQVTMTRPDWVRS